MVSQAHSFSIARNFQSENELHFCNCRDLAREAENKSVIDSSSESIKFKYMYFKQKMIKVMCQNPVIFTTLRTLRGMCQRKFMALVI